MEIAEFVEATSRVETYYNKEYTPEQRQIMFEQLGSMSIERYRKIVSVVISKCEYLPKIVKFKEASMELPREERKESEKVECSICNSTGWIEYKKIDSDTGHIKSYACRCTCKNGLNRNKKIPTFEELGIMPNETVRIKEMIYK